MKWAWVSRTVVSLARTFSSPASCGTPTSPNVAEGLQKSLHALGTDYLDLYLVHWPVRLVPNELSALLPVNPNGTRAVDRSWEQTETWRQMEEVYKASKVKAIGVANWSIPYLEDLKKRNGPWFLPSTKSSYTLLFLSTL
ncbi:NADP-dependent oxidoreductase domain-containing protein [Aspergillus granulosus]|uniref:NADP-dependent oxidoreductase domain-containing protein n=1 Tax=Aspergillus granulosus TaxID=176169 RepID=A0ABR4H757_9EURO